MNRLDNLPDEIANKIWRIVYWEVVEQLNTVDPPKFESYPPTPSLFSAWSWSNGKDKGWGSLHPIDMPKYWWRTNRYFPVD